MKITLQNQTTKHSNSATCTVSEYSFHERMLDLAVAKISGRYPESRRVVNTECHELVYVSDGEGKIVVNGVTHPLSAGDALLIEAGEKYYWEGNMQLVLSCRPAWNMEQHQVVD